MQMYMWTYVCEVARSCTLSCLHIFPTYLIHFDTNTNSFAKRVEPKLISDRFIFFFFNSFCYFLFVQIFLHSIFFPKPFNLLGTGPVFVFFFFSFLICHLNKTLFSVVNKKRKKTMSKERLAIWKLPLKNPE